ncbi:hypothetical protein [Snodgrassella alvi]|uniref:hypothetical protein n=1 Tax=Snodgrassella alvi TaxID=1196083 RepID=UPI00117A10DA|nr:hypothetical protein [Snodgrassella alvi]
MEISPGVSNRDSPLLVVNFTPSKFPTSDIRHLNTQLIHPTATSPLLMITAPTTVNWSGVDNVYAQFFICY